MTCFLFVVGLVVEDFTLMCAELCTVQEEAASWEMS